MRREVIEARLVQLRADFDAARLQMAAIDGAIQDCEFWLTQLDKEVPDEGSDTTPVL